MNQYLNHDEATLTNPEQQVFQYTLVQVFHVGQALVEASLQCKKYLLQNILNFKSWQIPVQPKLAKSHRSAMRHTDSSRIFSKSHFLTDYIVSLKSFSDSVTRLSGAQNLVYLWSKCDSVIFIHARASQRATRLRDFSHFINGGQPFFRKF